MILLPGQTANVTLKRDASNNVIYGATGTDDTTDKLVYSRGVNATITNANSQTNYGSSQGAAPAIARTITYNWSGITQTLNFPEIPGAYDICWIAYGLRPTKGQLFALVIKDFDTFNDEIIYQPISSNSWVYPTPSYLENIYYGNNIKYFEYRNGNGERYTYNVLGSSYYTSKININPLINPPVKELTTTLSSESPLSTTTSNTVNTELTSGGSVSWANANPIPKFQWCDLTIPFSSMTKTAVLTSYSTNIFYNVNTGAFSSINFNLGVPNSVSSYPCAYIWRVYQENNVVDTRYVTRTYNGSVKQLRNNADNSKFESSGNYSNPPSPTSILLTQTS